MHQPMRTFSVFLGCSFRKGKQSMKKRSLLVLLLFLALFLTSCGGKEKSSDKQSSSTAEKTTATTSSTAPSMSKTAVPTLFFHGYKGNRNSFGRMIRRIEKDDCAAQELILTVAPDGSVASEGALTGVANNPLVQVLFADNQNNEWNQAEWIKSALLYLQSTYGTQEVNIAGHSMGGVSTFRYLETYGGDASLPKVGKAVAIGAPFNEFIDSAQTQSMEELLANGPAEISDRFADFQSNAGGIPLQTQFLLIGGQLSEDDFSDGTVPLTSALAVHSLLTARGNPVSYQIAAGVDHSGLHEDREVDLAIEDFLWR